MSTPATLQRISLVYQQLSAGVPSESLRRILFSQLAEDFGRLSVDLATLPGWTAATGTATRATFDTATVTLPVLAQHVKALMDDLIARGDIGP